MSECVWQNGLSRQLRKGYFLIRDSHGVQDASSPVHYPPRSTHKTLERGGAEGRDGGLTGTGCCCWCCITFAKDKRGYGRHKDQESGQELESLRECRKRDAAAECVCVRVPRAHIHTNIGKAALKIRRESEDRQELIGVVNSARDWQRENGAGLVAGLARVQGLSGLPDIDAPGAAARCSLLAESLGWRCCADTLMRCCR